MQYLPTPEEQDWLVSRLAELVARRGPEHFLAMPIVEPIPRFFPDPWEFSHRGLDRMVRRLMQYAVLGDLGVQIGTYAHSELAGGDETTRHGRSIAGIFLGISGGECRFAFNETAPSDAEYMAGVLSHEVAHAFRVHHGLALPDSPDEEELLTDLTAVYLGFGILAANVSYRYRSAGGVNWQSWSSQRVGYLSPQAFAYLLGIQFIARGLRAGELRPLMRHLEPNQAAFVKAALEELSEQSVDFLEALHLPLEGTPFKRRPLQEILLPLPGYLPAAAAPDSRPQREPLPPDTSRPVFRLRRTHASLHGLLGGIAGMALAAFYPEQYQMFPEVFSSVLAGGLIGAFIGSRFRYEVCSDPDCQAVLEALEACPRCRRPIAGSIRHQRDRFVAGERWENGNRKSRSGEPDEPDP